MPAANSLQTGRGDCRWPMSALVPLVALSLLPVSRWRLVAEQLRAGQSASAILDDEVLRQEASPSLPLRTVSTILTEATRAIEQASRSGLEVVPWSDPGYPLALAAIIDPPPVLWLRGQPDALGRPAVAIVGSRAGSPYALAAAEALAHDLARSGVTVVSGLARGVDSAAHRGALAGGGATVAVLGCGADVVYPREHAKLATEIAGRGAIVSELIPGTPPDAWFFPRRNRIISGLVRAVVVIEAGQKSGSLITARCALEQGRDVLAVPGNILNGRNRGGHALLRDGARLVESADDGMGEMGLTCGVPTPQGPAVETHALLQVIPQGEAADLEEIAAKTGLSAAELLPRLMELELAGALRREPGGRFVRFDRTC